MRKASSWLVRAIATAVVLIFVLVALLFFSVHVFVGVVGSHDPFEALAERRHLRILPKEIEVTSLIAHGSDLRWAEVPLLFLQTIRRKGCGGYVFRLSGAAAVAIERHGTAYLKSARSGRDVEGSPEEVLYRYEPWQETPVPASWTGDSAWAMGLGCLGDAREFDARPVFKAAGEPGAYFTTGSLTELLVIPRLRLVVLTFHR